MTSLKQAARIERRLRRHANLTALIEAQGVDHEKASQIAYQIMKDEK